MKTRSKKNDIRYLWLFVLIQTTCMACYGQTCITDTIEFGKYKLIIPLFQGYRIHEFHYEEGTFRDYYFADSSGLLTIHYGTMVSKPIINNDNAIILSQSFIEGVEKERRGFFIKENRKKIFREKEIIPYSISILYMVEKDSILFDNIINNMRIIRYKE